MASKRNRYRSPRRKRGIALQAERLESRRFLADSAAPVAFAADVAESDSGAEMIRWQGQDYFGFRDSYVLRMPQTNTATSAGLWDYASDEPAIEAGWSLKSLGAGFFELTTPGATVEEVSVWSNRSGALFVCPNEALEKQTTDNYYPLYQWGLNNTGTPAGKQPPEGPLFPRKDDADIDMPEAWTMDGRTYTGSKAIIVAVLDDGIDWRHPDLAQNMWLREEAIDITTGSRITIPDSVTGVFGWDETDPVGFKEDPRQNIYSITPNPNNLTGQVANDSHGTHVAGIIGAKANNLYGVAGVNWDVGLYSAKIFQDGGRWGGSSAFIAAVNRIVRLRTQYRQAIVAANASFYTYSATTGAAMLAGVQALNQAGIVLVAAAGNGFSPCRPDGIGDNNDGFNTCRDRPVYPANLVGTTANAPADNVISVASSTARDTLSRFSNWGVATVDIAAPGENIWSTVATTASERVSNSNTFSTYATHEPFEDSNPGGQGERRMVYRTVPSPLIPFKNPVTGAENRLGGYASMSGTSMSAAYVSGTIALASYFYNFVTGALPSVAFLRSAILNGADTVSTLIYTEKSGTPGTTDPDYHTDAQGNGREGMFTPSTIDDPAPGRVHRIAGDRRLNAFGTLKWCRDNLPPSVFVTDARRVEGDTGTTQASFTATLRDIRNLPVAAGTPLTVEFWTEDIGGGATAGVDYVGIPSSAPRTFTIPAGQTQVTFSVDLIGDLVAEPDESFRLRFRMPVGSTSTWVRTKVAACTIVDDDPSDAKPLVRFAVGASGNPVTREVTEPDAGARTIFVSVSLDRVAKRAMDVAYEIKTPGAVPGMVATDMADLAFPYEPFTPSPSSSWTSAWAVAEYQKSSATPNLDYVAQRSTVRIPAGQQSAMIPVRILSDGLGERREYLSLRLLTPNLGVIKDASRVKVIAISDPPSFPVITQFSPPAVPVTEGQDAVFRIATLAPLPSGTSLAIFFNVLNGSARSGWDFVQPSSLKVVIPAGQSTADIRVATIRDPVTEAVDETFIVQIWKAVYTQPDGVTLDLGIAPLSATASIRDAVAQAVAGRA